MNRNYKSYHKRVRKDYQRQNSPNPFFHHSKEKTLKKKKSANFRIFKLILGIIIPIILIWFFLASPFFEIKNIDIKGLARISKQGIENTISQRYTMKRFRLFREKNIFLFDKKAAIKEIEDKYNVAEVNIRKSYPESLRITLKERPYAFMFKDGNNFYYASSDGHITPRTATSIGPMLPTATGGYFLVDNQSSSTMVKNNKLAISQSYINFIMNLHDALANHTDLKVSEYIVDSEFNTVKVQLVNGPLVYFNVEDSASSQVNNLILVKNEKIKDNFNRTKYIDLRYGSRIFINPDFN